MLYNIERDKEYYVLDRKAIEDECKNKILRVSKKRPAVGDGEVLHFSSSLLRYPALNKNGTLREATKKELIDKKIYKLEKDEFIVGDDVKSPKDYPIDESLVKPVFDFKVLRWAESATKEEIAESKMSESIAFYNEELVFASKATAELACLIISPESFEEVKSYMQSIDPYAKTKLVKKAKRPSVFDRYK